MAAVELRSGHRFAPDEFAAFLAAQPDLRTKWTPRFVRIVDALPVTGADKVAKLPLRAAAWISGDDVWWKPTRDEPYRPMDDAARRSIADQFATHGRTSLLPRAPL